MYLYNRQTSSVPAPMIDSASLVQLWLTIHLDLWYGREQHSMAKAKIDETRPDPA